MHSVLFADIFYQDKKARGLNKEKVKSGDWTSLSEEVAGSASKSPKHGRL